LADNGYDLDTATVEAFQTADHREAVSAFIEKRTPRFEGR
jgi:hypothetical protein